MKTKYRMYAAAFIVLLVVLTTLSVSSVSASGNSLPAPEGTPPPPSPQPDPGTPEPGTNSGSSSGNNGGGTIIQRIFNIIFDYRTMKDAIVASVNGMFEDAVGDISTAGSPIYEVGSEISEIVFQTEKLKELRLSTWLGLRKVAFALLPLVAAMTIWVSMKDGLYSVTGYANTLEAVTEFMVSIAIALASYWLMEQLISLTKSLTLAIAGAFNYDLEASVFMGSLLKPMVFANTSPVMAMIFYIFAFVFLVVFMLSVELAFLAREVVLIIAVGTAPLMIILGAVRPLAWLRAMWSKAFIVFLLLLPINVLLLGISAELYFKAMSLTTGVLATWLQMLILVGTISILIALNTMLGKIVYGAAIEVAQKVGSAFKDVVSLGAGIAGMAVGAGGVAALGGALGGSQGLAPAGGGGSGGGMLAGALNAGGDITSTGLLTDGIGSVLSNSSSRVLRGFGGGLRAGSEIQRRLPPPSSPPLNIANEGMPGYEAGIADVMEQFDTRQRAAGLGSTQEDLVEKTHIGADTAVANLRAVESAGGSAWDYLKETGYINRGTRDIEQVGREFIRDEAGSFAFGRTRSVFNSHQIIAKTPNQQGLHDRDFAAGLRIVQNEQKNPDSAFRDITPEKMLSAARAVQARRISGMNSNLDIIDSAADINDLERWINDSLGLVR